MQRTQENLLAIKTFSKPYYQAKDIMHDWTHIERVGQSMRKLLAMEQLPVDIFALETALMLHGIIYSIEPEIRQFLASIELPQQLIELIIKVAWESQKEERPSTPEGLILHDAHLLEGGQYFEIIKSLITGSVRGQSLLETLDYIKHNLLEKGECYTRNGQKQYELVKVTTRTIYLDLQQAIMGIKD